ncbi:Fc.00g023490.m01.CDS01 [Cosmosporella sp. VM-42]
MISPLDDLSDAWSSTYTANRFIDAVNENIPYVTLISEAVNSEPDGPEEPETDPDEPATDPEEPATNPEESATGETDDIYYFMTPEGEPSSQRRVKPIREFCLGAEPGLDDFVTPPIPLEDSQTPKIWVDDRNWDRLPPFNTRRYKKVLSNREFYKALCEQRLNNPQDDMVDVHRRIIFIGDGDGSSVLALIRTAPASQVDVVGKLISQYVKQNPATCIKARQSDWWHDTFDLNFTIPYFAIGGANIRDARSISKGQRLRSRYELSFLNTAELSHDGTALHEVVTSFCVTGLSERYWTAICFKDEFHEETPRLESDKASSEVSVDPITFMASVPLQSPRTYYLQALARNVARIVDNQKYIGEVFGASILPLSPTRCVLSREVRLCINKTPGTLVLVKRRVSSLKDKLRLFLEQDVVVDHDGIPRGRLFHSLWNDRLARKSLVSLNQSRMELGDIEEELQGYLDTCEALHRLVQIEHVEAGNASAREQQELARLVNERGLVQLVFGILNLVAQLWQSRPDNPSPKRDSMQFTLLLVIISILGTFALGWFPGKRWLPFIVRALAGG